MNRLSTAAVGALALIAAGTATSAFLPISAYAQGDRPAAHRSFSASRHLDGRIAYLKAELKITDAQAPLFDKLAGVMRDNAKAMDDARSSLRRDSNAPPPSALDRLVARTKIEQIRAQGSERFLDAFKPLYGSLSDDQKKSADAMLGGHDHFRHRRG